MEFRDPDTSKGVAFECNWNKWKLLARCSEICFNAMNPNTNSSISIVHITNCTDFSAADEEIPLLSITNNCNGNCSINDSIQKPASSGIWKCKQYLYLCPQWHHYQVVHCKIALTFSNKFPTNPKYSLKPSVGMRIMMMIVVRIWYRSWRVEYYNKNMIGINLPSYLYLEKGIRWRKTTLISHLFA